MKRIIAKAQPGLYSSDMMIYTAHPEGQPELDATGMSIVEAVGTCILQYSSHFNIKISVS